MSSRRLPFLDPTISETVRMIRKPRAASPGMSATLCANFNRSNMDSPLETPSMRHLEDLDPGAQRGPDRDIADAPSMGAHVLDDVRARVLPRRRQAAAREDHLLPVGPDRHRVPVVDLLGEALPHR